MCLSRPICFHWPAVLDHLFLLVMHCFSQMHCSHSLTAQWCRSSINDITASTKATATHNHFSAQALLLLLIDSNWGPRKPRSSRWNWTKHRKRFKLQRHLCPNLMANSSAGQDRYVRNLYVIDVTMERFLTECPQTKVITLANHKGNRSSLEPIKARN